MLMQLIVKDFALIDNIYIDFDDKLNVLTGETGAGKSIVIDAVGLLLGARAYSDDVRIGCNKAYIEGVFHLNSSHPVADKLQEMGFDLKEDSIVSMSREISSANKNICRINHKVVTLAYFKEIGQQLINIYGQHDFQTISNKEKHLSLLDCLGNETHKQLKQQLKQSYENAIASKKQLEEMKLKISNSNERLEFLKFKIQELQELDLKQGEEEEIEQELLILDNVEKITDTTSKAYQWLYGEQHCAYALISKAYHKIETITDYDKNLLAIAENLKTIMYQIEDDSLTLAKYKDQIDFDATYKQQLDERKYHLDRAKKKYNASIVDMIKQRDSMMVEIQQLENGEDQLEKLEKQYQQRYKDAVRIAKEITNIRLEIANEFEKQLIMHLKDLAMSEVKFQVKISEKELTENGIDAVEFLLSSNPGQPLRPLSMIASGGEMSRIMLAFKTILAQLESIDTIIFDEIDSGIGGNIVVKVAEKLAAVSQGAQVICVTHAPPIAALAQKHFKIKKNIIDQATQTDIVELNFDEQIIELARMLGGNEEYHLQHAKELKK